MAFPETQTEGDDRRPMSARFNGADGYREAVRAAAEDLAATGLMRDDDIDLIVDSAPAFAETAR